MVIIMREITKNQKAEFVEKILPLAKRLRMEGLSDREIEGVVYQYVRIEKKKLYSPPYPESLRIDTISQLNDLGSKAEAIVYFFLEKYKIDFKTQYEIGPYRADFLIDSLIVLEIDGPRHDEEYDKRRDEFIRNRGFLIVRVPIWVFSLDPVSVVEELNELSNEISRKIGRMEREFFRQSLKPYKPKY
jgi:very-short-patch-repair endonuclease